MTDISHQLPDEWTSFLAGFVWDHTATLTTRYPRSELSLRNDFVGGFVRRQARMAGHGIAWFFAMEATHAGQLHIHALLGGTATLTIKQLQWAWKGGHTEITRVGDHRDAIRYLTKEFGCAPDRYDLSRRLIPRREASDAG